MPSGPTTGSSQRNSRLVAMPKASAISQWRAAEAFCRQISQPNTTRLNGKVT
ncbi:MAG: hypothetical protein HC889_17420 [Synechococcaceae cyanobacterium SM1_2_3]|nr:hypothetical protein [Synechococcaceae cyanobacterium SM1_2_3]